ncbi:cytochrome P450 [Flavobacterium sp. LS1R49]|uniref:Cytochrome P450 n=1 Tax=Flavobacterium shii TaxID=2987687 RepID=A0A9X2ZK99_9FLAO|nr:cytochrome P450 [Flavobacterium shii]MCV9930321.1 cytochrome P450 [Flavobacterium shii]
MPSSLFLQSDIKNPYSIYKTMLDEHAIYWDETNKIWAIYSHEYCTEILNSTNVHIPIINRDNEQKLNEYSLKIINHLLRLSNGIQHEITKEIAMLLFSNMKSIDNNQIIAELINNGLVENKIDWVNSLCKKLPVLVILKSFGFKQNDCDFFLEKIELLVKIMLPNKTTEQVQSINKITEDIYLIIEDHLTSLPFYLPLLNKVCESYKISLNEAKTIFISNLIGLFIQSYDAGRGILSNSLLQLLAPENIIAKKNANKIQIQKSVIETLRFDPPIHNTRRVAISDIRLREIVIKKNDPILLVLAAANRDPEKFNNPMKFDIERNNNNENLTFGTGGHMCLAKHFSIHQATEALWYLLENYPRVKILENNTQYEPMINARLPKNIWISLL